MIEYHHPQNQRRKIERRTYVGTSAGCRVAPLNPNLPAVETGLKSRVQAAVRRRDRSESREACVFGDASADASLLVDVSLS